MSFHLIVPGHGIASRTAELLNSVVSVRESILRSSLLFACTVYVYSSVDISHLPCKIVRMQGKWVRFMAHIRTHATYVAVLMDDVSVPPHSALNLIRHMQSASLDIISPSFQNWAHPAMRPTYASHYRGRPRYRNSCCIKETGYVDVLFTIFRSRAWQCWQKLLDPVRNPDGWGTDIIVAEKCNASIGVSDFERARHLGKKRTYAGGTARRNMLNWLADIIGSDAHLARAYRFSVLRRESKCVSTMTPAANCLNVPQI